jgi:large subunit ribosomal protein L25
MEQIELKAKIRDGKGKNAANRLRAANEVPAVVYGKSHDNLMVALQAKDIRKIAQKGGNILLNLKIDGKEDQVVLIKETQYHPVSGIIIHVDLLKVSMQEEIEVKVQIKLAGDAAGVKLGGIMEQHLREIRVRCLITNIPSEILVDVSALGIGDALHVSDLVMPENVKLLENKEEVVLTISAHKVEEEKPAEEAGPTEPEVIGEKEREERRAEAEKSKEEKGKEKTEAKTEDKK